MEQPSVSTIKIIRWIARILSILIITFHLVSFMGDQSSADLTSLDIIKLILWGIVLFGLAISWRYEIFGAIAIIGTSVIQQIINPVLMTMWFFWIVYFVGIFFLICGMDKRKRKGTMTAKENVRRNSH